MEVPVDQTRVYPKRAVCWFRECSPKSKICGVSGRERRGNLHVSRNENKALVEFLAESKVQA